MTRRTKLKKAVTLAASVGGVKPHDRRSTDLLHNARVGTVVVEDPFEAGAKITVFRSLRDDPLAAMHTAGQLDDAQFLAGRRWQEIKRICQVGDEQAIDPAKEAVDGGRGPGGITDQQIDAFKDQSKALRALGIEGGYLIQLFLDKGLTLTLIAEQWGWFKERDRDFLGRRLRECLDTLAVVFGYATRVIPTSNRPHQI
jgi:hypothetical protein